MFSKRSFLALCATLAIVGHQVSKQNLGYAFLWYIIFSYLYMIAPTLLHTEKARFEVPLPRSGYSKLLVAHRGGAQESPENTTQAFSNSLLNGCQMLEMDVRMTKDKQLIVCHDADFERLCGDPRKVNEVSVEALPTFKQSMPV